MEIVSVGVDLAPGPGGPSVTSRWWSSPEPWSPAVSSQVASGALRCGVLEVHMAYVELGSGCRVDVTVRNPRAPGARSVSLDRFRARLAARPRRVLEHGWQSWSPVARRSVGEIQPIRRVAPRWVRQTYHAAPELAGRAITGDQFLLVADGCGRQASEGGVAGFLDGRRHLSSIVATGDGLMVVALLDGVVLEPGSERALDPLWLANGDPGPCYSEYVTHWAAVSGARSGGPSALGWSSWYQYFSKVTPAQLRSNLGLAARHGVELFQIDDGYQRVIGEWTTPNDRFAPGAVPLLAAEVARAGLQPGIWTAPFLASPRSSVAREHPEWLAGAKRARGAGARRSRPCRAMWNPIAWGGWALALDTTHPGVLDHLRETFSSLVADGWTYHKIDFCYAAAVPAVRAGDGRMTRAQSLRAGLEAVREGIGEGSVLLGCGIPLGQSVGVLDVMRVSADTGRSWRPGPLRVPGYPDTSPSASSAVQASVLRAPMHRRLWVNDPDCLLLRPSRTKLTGEQRRVVAAVAAGAGGFVVVSDDLSTYRSEEWELLERLRALHERVDRPLDISDPFAPVIEVSGHGGLRLDTRWEGAAGAPGGDGRGLIEGGSAAGGPWARLSQDR